MELRHLRYFVEVAEIENVSRAALKLHISQPAVSRQIRDLEDEIGLPLLKRNGKAVRLTDAGHVFLSEARSILKKADDAVLKTRVAAGKHKTGLNVGDFPLVTARVMPQLLQEYRKTMLNVQVKLHDWPVEKEIAGVRSGQLQLAIIIPPLTGNWRSELRFQELETIRVCLAVSCNHPFARRKSVSLAEAAREPFVGLVHDEYPQHRVYVKAIFARVKDKPRFVEEHDGWVELLLAVDAGAGVAIASDAFIYPFGDRVKLVPLTPEPKRASIGIISRKWPRTPETEKFCECAKTAFALHS